MGNDYKGFTTSVLEATGIDLNLYKERQMKRRLTSLRDKNGFDSFSTYFKAIETDELLFEQLLDRITINVSQFYRNRKRWDKLSQDILPKVLKDKNSVKAWSAACSTGEEPYTLSIILRNMFPPDKIDILATDLDEHALQKAKKGIYQESAIKELSSKEVQKYFTQKGSLYYFTDEYKKSIRFEQHNLLADRYPSHFDLICCRNVLIYFTDEAKKKIYQSFVEALADDGILFVGSTEQIFNPEQYGLRTVDTFIYQKVKRGS